MTIQSGPINSNTASFSEFYRRCDAAVKQAGRRVRLNGNPVKNIPFSEGLLVAGILFCFVTAVKATKQIGYVDTASTNGTGFKPPAISSPFDSDSYFVMKLLFAVLGFCVVGIGIGIGCAAYMRCQSRSSFVNPRNAIKIELSLEDHEREPLNLPPNPQADMIPVMEAAEQDIWVCETALHD